MEVALDISLRNTNQRRSFSSEDDNESIHSVQAKETDVVQDTNSDEYGDFSSASTFALEYEVATSDSDDAAAAQYEVLLGTGADGVTSSGEDDMHVTAAIAAVLYDTSMEAWATGCEDSDTTAYNDSLSSAASTSGRGADFWTCLQCNGRNDQPQVRYCDKCFQRCWQCKTRKNYNCFPLCNDCYKVRKNLFPPRPRGARKRKMERQAAEEAQIMRKRRASNSCDEPPVKLTALRNCLSGLSQDSGLGSSQEIPGLNFDKIIMPKHPQQGVKRTRNCSSTIESDTEPFNSATKHCTDSKKARLELPIINDVNNLPSTSNAVIVNVAIVSVETTRTIPSNQADNTIVGTSSVVRSKEITLNSIPIKSIDVLSSSKTNDVVTTSSKILSNATSLNTRALSDTDLPVASSSKLVHYSESNAGSSKLSEALEQLDSTGQTESSEFERDVATSSAKDIKLKANARDIRTQSTSDLGSVDICSKDARGEGSSLPELKELCMICNDSPKNAIFLHGKIAHLCCCYKCAMKTWRISKRCPMCNCKVKNVVKVYST